jgi:hypothetical protein
VINDYMDELWRSLWLLSLYKKMGINM